MGEKKLEIDDLGAIVSLIPGTTAEVLSWLFGEMKKAEAVAPESIADQIKSVRTAINAKLDGKLTAESVNAGVLALFDAIKTMVSGGQLPPPNPGAAAIQ